VLNEYKIGRSYDEIAQALKVKTKSVDNALVRIKRKIAEVPLGHADIDTVLIYS
jgi:DNA-directed RNA polymerase specialized sigma24 family protein